MPVIYLTQVEAIPPDTNNGVKNMKTLTLEILEAVTDYRVYRFLCQFPNTHESFEGVETFEFIHTEGQGHDGYVLVTYY